MATIIVSTRKSKIEYLVYDNYKLIIKTTNKRIALIAYSKIKYPKDKN
jgi:hypothetical protein